MKYILLLFLFFHNCFISAQQNKIDKSTIVPKEIDFKDCVKKITIKNYTLNKKNDKIDTVKTISEINFSKKGKIEFIRNYNNSLNDLWRIVEFDDLERIKTMSRKNDGKIKPFVNQYFSKKAEFPDSTIINNHENYREKYVNYFKNDLVIKQDHFVNGLLQDYRIYKYNDQNQLVEDLYLNPENDTDETVVFKSDNEMSFYPERLTLYEHQKINDTLITIKNRPKFSLKEVTKKMKTDKFFLVITEEYDKDFLEKARFVYTYKDSISETSYSYKNKREIKNYFKTFTSPKSIVSKWKMEGYSNNEERTEIIKIDVVYDRFKNWTKKTYSKDNLVIKILEREIDYYCH